MPPGFAEGAPQYMAPDSGATPPCKPGRTKVFEFKDKIQGFSFVSTVYASYLPTGRAAVCIPLSNAASSERVHHAQLPRKQGQSRPLVHGIQCTAPRLLWEHRLEIRSAAAVARGHSTWKQDDVSRQRHTSSPGSRLSSDRASLRRMTAQEGSNHVQVGRQQGHRRPLVHGVLG